MDLSVCGLGGVTCPEPPVPPPPLVPEFLSVHASNTVTKVRLVDPEEAKAIHLPVTWWGRVPSRRQVLEGWWLSGGHTSMLVMPQTLGMIWVLEEVPRGQA